MSWILSFVLFAFGVYIVYNTISMILFGVPHSLSMTYYLFKEQGFNLRYLFPILIATMVVCLMPGWIEISEGSTYQFTAFLSAAGLAFVGAAPMFLKDNNVYAVHTTGALVSALFAILWIVLVAKTFDILLICGLGCLLLMFVTKTTKSSYIYWLENIAFLSTFISIIKYYYAIQ